MSEPIHLGAVAYAPRVVPIWEGMCEYFAEAGLPIDYTLFSHYDLQVRALLSGQIDIAWNTNLAWIKVHHFSQGRCRALAMRDVDARFTTILAVRADSGVASLADVRGKRIALGSADSAQAAFLPWHFLQQAGVEPERDCSVLRFDLDVGKHGDTGSSELEVLRALHEGQADVGALGETTWHSQMAEGKIDVRQVRLLWTSPGYCHCNFSALDRFPRERGEQWTETLLAMHADDPRWRKLMDLEGLKRWVRADAAILEGYRVLFETVEKQGLSATWNI
jgi:ABC-type phosphate/phosphonate transport system substrate-binding protein